MPCTSSPAVTRHSYHGACVLKHIGRYKDQIGYKGIFIRASPGLIAAVHDLSYLYATGQGNPTSVPLDDPDAELRAPPECRCAPRFIRYLVLAAPPIQLGHRRKSERRLAYRRPATD